ncbi:hypothetical protein EDB92DRAFT_159015 [Lactarius akahatsu]|uniref:PH domain-containing protein n=1 Tax=Lactarius akahatsu TaxID=416441 RepID=A0AAD4QFN8_9AGAM|nr:hypothetical protein EDB92DRAFT_159015 [Lactarius akahatsu]
MIRENIGVSHLLHGQSFHPPLLAFAVPMIPHKNRARSGRTTVPREAPSLYLFLPSPDCQRFRTNLEATTHQLRPGSMWEFAKRTDVPDASISATVSFQSLRSTSGESSTRIACSEKCGISSISLWGSCSGRSGKRMSAWHAAYRCESTMRTCKGGKKYITCDLSKYPNSVTVHLDSLSHGTLPLVGRHSETSADTICLSFHRKTDEDLTSWLSILGEKVSHGTTDRIST